MVNCIFILLFDTAKSKGGAVVRALASHQCGPGSNPGVDAICGLSLLLVLSLAPRGFSPGTPVFPSPQKPTLPNSNSIWNARTRLNEFIWTLKCFVGKKASYNFFFLFFLTAAAFQYDNGSDQSKSLMNFLRHFNQNRHHVTNPEGKQKARDFIKKTFKDLGLITWSESFKPDFPQARFKLSFYWIGIDGNDDFCV